MYRLVYLFIFIQISRYHENCRIFQDRLVNDEDRNWFKLLLEEKLVNDFQMKFSDVVTRVPLFYGDFMIPSAEVKIYNEITDENKVCSLIVFSNLFFICYCVYL